MIIIGVDPGRKGAIAEIDLREKYVRWMKIPYREDGLIISSLIKDHFDFDVAHRIAIEDVGFIRGSAGRATFSFGENYGKIRQFLEPYPYELIRPQAWHRCINGPKKDGDETDTKKRSKASFQRMNPAFGKIVQEHHEGMIDAFFIAYYCGFKNGVIMPTGFTFDEVYRPD